MADTDSTTVSGTAAAAVPSASDAHAAAAAVAVSTPSSVPDRTSSAAEPTSSSIEEHGGRKTTEATPVCGAGGALTGWVVCVTGVLSRPRAEVVAMIQDAGGLVTRTVSKKTTHVLLGSGAEGSSKHSRAVELDLEVVTEDALVLRCEEATATATDKARSTKRCFVPHKPHALLLCFTRTDDPNPSGGTPFLREGMSLAEAQDAVCKHVGSLRDNERSDLYRLQAGDVIRDGYLDYRNVGCFIVAPNHDKGLVLLDAGDSDNPSIPACITSLVATPKAYWPPDPFADHNIFILYLAHDHPMAMEANRGRPLPPCATAAYDSMEEELTVSMPGVQCPLCDEGDFVPFPDSNAFSGELLPNQVVVRSWDGEVHVHTVPVP